MILGENPYIPETISEIWDMLGMMMLSSPTFADKYFVNRSVETEFYRLNEAFKIVRPKLGEERYAALVALSDRMRALFEADPEDKTGETTAGKLLIYEMEDILRPKRRKR